MKRYIAATLVLCLVCTTWGCAARMGSTRSAPATGVNLLTGYPALRDDGLIHVVVEIPAGTNAKWEVDKSGQSLVWKHKKGKPRVVEYLAYPANYGMIPRTHLPKEIGGDGDPLDVVLLGPAIERGSVVPARPIGILRLIDDGERDDKIVAVPLSGPLSDVSDFEELDVQYAGVREILEMWFTRYKGPGRLESKGFEGADAATDAIREANAQFESRSREGERQDSH